MIAAGRVLFGLALLAALLPSCAGADDLARFCEQAASAQEAGPLFPDRTDGEPVANLAALDALERLAATAPPELTEHLGVLVEEARALTIAAAARRGATLEGVQPAGPRPGRSRVEAAQEAVLDAVREDCALDLASHALNSE